MTNPKDAETGRDNGVSGILARYTSFINRRPALISLLYDIDLLPEQVTGFADAIKVAAFCEVWRKGETGTLPAPDGEDAQGDTVDIEALADQIRHVDASNSLCASALADALSPYVSDLVSDAVTTACRNAAPFSPSDYVNGALGASV